MKDLEFVRRCVKGDKQAWDEFVEKYSRLIYNYIFAVLSSRNYSFAQNHLQDIFQEIFTSLIKDDFKKLSSFKAKNGCSLASWLRQVAINFTIDYLCKLKPAVSLDEEIAEGASLKDILADHADSAPGLLAQKEKLGSLKDCIARLKPADRFLLELHLNRGLNLEKIKEIFRVSRGAIDMQKSRIVARLRECFQSKGFLLDY
ncbi:MAG: sigma-70 family RNA polymerase sigma factor [Candidatus Omnitrophota bacterium]|nr:sigma-70 family RNA polymerase sigma factor [Candidatus Omnitrophota bacterium]